MKQYNNNSDQAEQPEVYIKGSGKDQVYLEFYHLNEAPFSMTPDPEFLYFSNTHQSVIDKILYGINNRIGFILLAGEVGTGKTTICRSILDSMDGMAEMVYIINPSLSGRELISSILDDLGVAYLPDSSKKDLINHLNQFALSATNNRPIVIIIDDAQTMPVDALEDLRLLSNLETDKEKLLQMVLVGQPELIELIGRPEIRQLRQRVAINCHLDFLASQEVEDYIARRLFVAGDNGRIRFTSKAKKQIARASKGIPRLINKICDYALTSGYIANDFTIGPKHIKRALLELGDLDFKNAPLNAIKLDRLKANDRSWIRYSLYGAMILVIILLAIYQPGLNILRPKDNIESSPGRVVNSIAKKEVFQPVPPISKSERTDQALANIPEPVDITQEITPTGPALSGVTQSLQKTFEEEKPDNGTVVISETKQSARMVTGSTQPSGTAPEFGTVQPASSGKSIVDEPVSSSSFIIQFGSYRSIRRVKAAYNLYKKRGLDVHWNRVDLGEKGIWYRVFSGSFRKRKDAIQFRADHGLFESIVVFAPWTVVVAESTDQIELDRMRSALIDNHIDGYTLQREDGSYSLLTGAFVTEKGAGELAKDIIALGYAGKVVSR